MINDKAANRGEYAGWYTPVCYACITGTGEDSMLFGATIPYHG